jgi:hypothetical protein
MGNGETFKVLGRAGGARDYIEKGSSEPRMKLPMTYSSRWIGGCSLAVLVAL